MSDDQNVGVLIADSGRLMRRTFERRLEGGELTYAQARTLLYVSRNEGLRQVELAELMEIQPISLARLIDQLQAQQLVERRPDPRDRRAYQLFLTPAATKPLAHFKQIGAEIRELMLAGLSEQQRAELQSALITVRNNLGRL